MSKQLAIDLPDVLYDRLQQASPAKKRQMVELVVQVLDNLLPCANPDGKPERGSELDEAMDREMEAYIAMHPLLKEKYFGKHVTVYQGQLIDVAADLGTLHERIRTRYPDEFVWMSQVKTEPIETIYNRTVRLEPIN